MLEDLSDEEQRIIDRGYKVVAERIISEKKSFPDMPGLKNLFQETSSYQERRVFIKVLNDRSYRVRIYTK